MFLLLLKQTREKEQTQSFIRQVIFGTNRYLSVGFPKRQTKKNRFGMLRINENNIRITHKTEYKNKNIKNHFC
jgi:hypothetical protein